MTDTTDRDIQATYILAGMLANPAIVGLAGAAESPRVYLLDDGKSRLALCHRAYLIADDMRRAAEIQQVQTGDSE